MTINHVSAVLLHHRSTRLRSRDTPSAWRLANRCPRCRGITCYRVIKSRRAAPDYLLPSMCRSFDSPYTIFEMYWRQKIFSYRHVSRVYPRMKGVDPRPDGP